MATVPTESDSDERPASSLVDRVPPGLVFRWAASASAGLLIVLLLAYGIYIARGILVLVLVAMFIAISLDPAVRWMVRKGLRRSLAVSIVVLVLVALTAVFIWSVVPPMVACPRSSAWRSSGCRSHCRWP